MAHEILVALDVRDDGQYQAYRDAMTPLLVGCGGSFGYDFKVAEVLKTETTAAINRVFTIRFPSRQAKDDFFADPGYLAAKARHFAPSVAATTIIAEYETG
ncbi:DUF1330 domain-containing protein [Gallaecimonas sp. GXIMD4217]|uniref:DUF1330 domain-containing protein n=1 Tax=Gallaecimonas sp. GXIMD4217 TaxID=3131927 RepID=UPI00311AF267